MKEIWLRRSDEWIIENPGKGTMYKGFPSLEPKDCLRSVNCQERKKYIKGDLDQGIYTITCELAKSVYVGQSYNMSLRMRSHKSIMMGFTSTQNRTYDKILKDVKTYGIEAFIFKKHHRISDQVDLNVLREKEADVMFHFVNEGYTLYNTHIPGNIACPDQFIEVVTSVISKLKLDPSFADKIMSIIS